MSYWIDHCRVCGTSLQLTLLEGIGFRADGTRLWKTWSVMRCVICLGWWEVIHREDSPYSTD